MDVRKVILLVGALLIAAVTAFVARNMFAGGGAPTANAASGPAVIAVEGPKVLVAVKPMPVGTIIAPDMVKFQPWPSDMIDKAYFLQDATNIANLVGKVVRFEVTAGQPLPQGAVVGPGERGFLAAALGAGMRALSVAVTDTTGVGGFIFPGDRVDIVLTQEVPGEGLPLKVSETILRNVRILAVDQSIDNAAKEAKVGRTVTLELTPKFAEKVSVAQSIGTLSLSLRSLAENTADLDRAIATGEVSITDDQSSATDRALELALARQPQDGAPTATTGGEVSRFQRNSMPSQKSASSEATGSSSGGKPDKPAGPVVRVARGNAVTPVELGAN